jgi:hypothetical protein
VDGDRAAAAASARLGIDLPAVVVAWVFFRAADFGMARAMLSAMFGGNGISLSPLLARFLAPLAVVLPLDFNGTFQNNLFSAFDAMEMVGLGLLLAVAAPNTQEIFSRFAIALGPAVRSGWWRFRGPAVAWAAVFGVALGVAVLMISGDSPFLYFRF